MITTKNKLIEIKETKDRNVLNEGRDNGMAFAMLKKISENLYETVQPFSPCKDYLAEVIFTENTDIGTNGCGLDYPKKLNIFENDIAYMGICILKSKKGSYYYQRSFSKDIELLNDNYKNITKFINYFEDRFKVNGLTEIIKADDNQFLVTVPIKWTASTAAISLYTLLLRMALDYKEQDNIEYLNSIAESSLHQDSYLAKTLLNKLSSIENNLDKLFEIPADYLESAKALLNIENNTTRWSPHGQGILSFKI